MLLQWPSFSRGIIKLSSYLNFSWSKTSRLSWAHQHTAAACRHNGWKTLLECVTLISMSVETEDSQDWVKKRRRDQKRGVIIAYSNSAEWVMTYQLTATKSNKEEVRVNGCVEGYLHIWLLGPIINTQAERSTECFACLVYGCCHIDSWQSVHAYIQSICNNIICRLKKYASPHLYEST